MFLMKQWHCYIGYDKQTLFNEIWEMIGNHQCYTSMCDNIESNGMIFLRIYNFDQVESLEDKFSLTICENSNWFQYC